MHLFNKVRIYRASTLLFFFIYECISSSDADKYHFCFVLSINLCTFAPEASRADTRKSGLANRVLETTVVKAAIKRIQRKHAFFVERKQARQYNWQVRCGSNIIHFKTFQVMQQSIYYIKFALLFADMQITELVNIFNRQVGNRSWTSMRAYHDQALIDEFQRRGIDTAIIKDGRTITFAHPVRYDLPNNRLTVIS